jgi:hypothetical protein
MLQPLDAWDETLPQDRCNEVQCAPGVSPRSHGPTEPPMCCVTSDRRCGNAANAGKPIDIFPSADRTPSAHAPKSLASKWKDASHRPASKILSLYILGLRIRGYFGKYAERSDVN